MQLAGTTDVKRSKMMAAIVKIQATMRGRLVRLRLEKIKNLLKQNDQSGEFDDTIPESAFFFN